MKIKKKRFIAAPLAVIAAIAMLISGCQSEKDSGAETIDSESTSATEAAETTALSEDTEETSEEAAEDAESGEDGENGSSSDEDADDEADDGTTDDNTSGDAANSDSSSKTFAMKDVTGMSEIEVMEYAQSKNITIAISYEDVADEELVGCVIYQDIDEGTTTAQGETLFVIIGESTVSTSPGSTVIESEKN